jgi:Tim44-like domain
MIVGVQNMPDSRRKRHVGNDGSCGLQKQARVEDWLRDLSGWKLILSTYIPCVSFSVPTIIFMVLSRAGASVVLHKDSPRQEAWNRMKETNPVLRRLTALREAYDESENPVVSSMRSVTSTIGSWFDENETAQVMKLMKALDPTFNKENFERELREYIVPEVVDAYLSADQEALREWCGEGVGLIFLIFSREINAKQTYNVLWATMEQYLRQGLISDSKVLDIRQVDVRLFQLSNITTTTHDYLTGLRWENS